MIRSKIIVIALIAVLAGTNVSAAAQGTQVRTRATLWQLHGQTADQGMSYVLATAAGTLLVVDGGWHEDASHLLSFLQTRGNHVTAWFVTHPHRDHIGALNEILAMKAEGRCSIMIDAVYASLPSQSWVTERNDSNALAGLTEFLQRAPAAGIRVIPLAANDTLSIDGLSIDVLLAHDTNRVSPASVNDSCLVFRITDGEKSILFLGDIQESGGAALLDLPQARLRADVVQVAHHGNPRAACTETLYGRINACYYLWPTPVAWFKDDKNSINEFRQRLTDRGAHRHFTWADSELIELGGGVPAATSTGESR